MFSPRSPINIMINWMLRNYCSQLFAPFPFRALTYRLQIRLRMSWIIQMHVIKCLFQIFHYAFDRWLVSEVHSENAIAEFKPRCNWVVASVLNEAQFIHVHAITFFWGPLKWANKQQKPRTFRLLFRCEKWPTYCACSIVCEPEIGTRFYWKLSITP